jgi:hypothetical protein
MKYRFSGHQTFPLRYPWLTKGVRALVEDEQVFFRDDALVRLGVGKNMVSGIRFWCEATKMAVIDGRRKTGRPSDLGEALFGHNGWDPYLEHPGTLWLIHWQLASEPADASTWYLALTKWNRELFAKDELVDWLEQVAERTNNRRVSRNSLQRDVDVFLRTYVPAEPDKRRPIEDTFDCPLVELGLMRQVGPSMYEMPRASRPTLPVEVFALALTRFWHRQVSGAKTLSFESVLYGAGSPGAAFRLSEPALTVLLEQLPEWTGVRYDETAGLRNLVRGPAELPTPVECLRRYYEPDSASEDSGEVAA